MAISKAKKNEILDNLIKNIKNAKSIWFAQTNGMSVSEFYDLRKELRTVNTNYIIAKKTLIKIAVKEALNLDLDLNLLPWQIWIIFSNDDAISWLSKTNDFIKKTFNKKSKIQKIDWVASIFEWKINWAEETKIIASIPSRETLLGRLIWSMKSPISSMARFLSAASKEIETKWKTKLWEIQKKAE